MVSNLQVEVATLEEKNRDLSERLREQGRRLEEAREQIKGLRGANNAAAQASMNAKALQELRAELEREKAARMALEQELEEQRRTADNST